MKQCPLTLRFWHYLPHCNSYVKLTLKPGAERAWTYRERTEEGGKMDRRWWSYDADAGCVVMECDWIIRDTDGSWSGSREWRCPVDRLDAMPAITGSTEPAPALPAWDLWRTSP